MHIHQWWRGKNGDLMWIKTEEGCQDLSWSSMGHIDTMLERSGPDVHVKE